MADTSLTELRIALLDLKERVPLLIEMNALDAKLKYAKFTALQAQGFTAEQALQLVK